MLPEPQNVEPGDPTQHRKENLVQRAEIVSAAKSSKFAGRYCLIPQNRQLPKPQQDLTALRVRGRAPMNTHCHYIEQHHAEPGRRALQSARSSARLGPTDTSTTDAPASLAALTRRKALYTISELPTTSKQSVSAASCSARVARGLGIPSPTAHGGKDAASVRRIAHWQRN